MLIVKEYDILLQVVARDKNGTTHVLSSMRL